MNSACLTAMRSDGRKVIRLVELGLGLSNDVLPGRGYAGSRIGELKEQTELARDLGYAAISISHHHSAGDIQWLHPVVTLAAMADRAGDMDINLFYLVGQYHPVEVAEQIASLDAVTEGRLRVTLAPGWTQADFDPLGLVFKERLSRFRECVEVLTLLLEGERVSYAGRHFSLDGVRLSHLPQQIPRPRIWMGASTPKAARRVARMADSFGMSGHAQVSEVVSTLAAYRDELALLGKPTPGDLYVNRNCFIADTDEEARRLAEGPLVSQYSEFADAGLFRRVFSHDLQIGPGDGSTHEDELFDDRFIVGSPDRARNGITAVSEQLDVHRIYLRMQWPGLGQAGVLRSIELAAGLKVDGANG